VVSFVLKVEAVVRGEQVDENEIRRFLAEDYARLVNGLALLCGSLPAAEDAVQEALARAWERAERGRRPESTKAWVTTVARNLLRDRFRRMRAERRAHERLPQPAAEGPAGAETRMDLARALAALPRRQREVAVFRFYLDLDPAEIAAVLGIPEGTARGALHRARRSLAEALQVNDDVMEANDVG
jgi:RNA polymerase sigma-70 factor, ECF subfamily